MSNALEGLKWRYACKSSIPKKKVSEADLKIIAESLRLTASSYGLQLWHFYFVSNDELRKEMLPHCWGQKQIVDSSHVLVMARKKTTMNRTYKNWSITLRRLESSLKERLRITLNS